MSPSRFPIATIENKWRSEHENEANAKLICEAVNNYSKLKEINKELVETLEDLLFSHFRLSAQCDGSLLNTPLEDKCQQLIEKAKQ